MASRVYKSLPKKGGHVYREHRSKKGRIKKHKPDYSLQTRQAKREKREVARHVAQAFAKSVNATSAVKNKNYE
jgi:hypothetical protein